MFNAQLMAQLCGGLLVAAAKKGDIDASALVCPSSAFVHMLMAVVFINA